MRSSDRILEVKKRITEYHGKVDDIRIYNRDPYPSRKKDNMKQNKPRVPPFREIEKLKELKAEFELKEKKREQKEERRAKQKEANEPIEESEEEEEKNTDPFYQGPPKDKYEILKHYDFPTTMAGENIVEYDHKEISLYEIFGKYGTVERPKPHHKSKDPPPPQPAPKPVKPPTPVAVKEEGEGSDDPDGGMMETKGKLVEEEPEEVYIPPVDETLWYDY